MITLLWESAPAFLRVSSLGLSDWESSLLSLFFKKLELEKKGLQDGHGFLSLTFTKERKENTALLKNTWLLHRLEGSSHDERFQAWEHMCSLQEAGCDPQEGSSCELLQTPMLLALQKSLHQVTDGHVRDSTASKPYSHKIIACPTTE